MVYGLLNTTARKSKMTPSINSTIETVVNSQLKQVWTSEPGVIQSFDASNRTCSVKVASRTLLPNGTTVEQPVIPDVPVHVAGGGGAEITFPLTSGDPCIIMFASHEIDQWFAGKDVPNDPRTHAYHDCFVLPGMHSPANAPSEYATSAMELGFQSGPRVAMTSSTCHLGVDSGATATEAAVLGNAQKSAFDAFVDSLKTALSTVLSTGALTPTGTVAFAGLPALGTMIDAAKAQYDAAQFLSTKVKVK